MMKKLFIILSLFTCFKAFGQTPTSPTPVNQMTWYKDLGGHMWAYRGATLGWIQMIDFSQLGAVSFLPRANNGLTVAADSIVQLGGDLIQDVFINASDFNFNITSISGGNTSFLELLNHTFNRTRIGFADNGSSPVYGSQSFYYKDRIDIQTGTDETGLVRMLLNNGQTGDNSYSLKIFDGPLNKGMQYNADYSTVGKLDNRWIPDWGAVKSIIPDTASINGKVDTATYDVFLLAIQQSNGQGHGDSTSSTKIVPGSALMYYNGIISPLKDPVGNAIYGSAWPAFALRYYKLTGHKLLFVPRAKGGSAMCFQSEGGNGRWSPSGLLRYQARDTMYAALAKMAVQGLKIGKISGIMVQGEQDGPAIVAGTETIAQYRDTTANTIAFFRGYWPKMQWGIIRTGKTVGFDFDSGPRSGQEQVAAADSLTQIISRITYDFPERGYVLPDGIHYNQRGLNLLGDDAAQEFVAGFKYSNTYNSFQKTGMNVNTPLAFVDIAASNDTIPTMIWRTGIIGSTTLKGGIVTDGVHPYWRDNSSVNHQFLHSAVQAGIPQNNVTYADANGYLTSDTTLQYTGTKLSIGVQAATYSASSRVDIKGTGTTNATAALNIYNSNNTLMYRFLNNQQFIIQAGGTFNVGTGSGGIATALIQGGTSANTNYTAVFRNSSSVQQLALRDDGRVEFNGAQQVRLPTIAGDPGSTAARDIWYNSSTGQFRVNRASTVFNLAINPMTAVGDIVIGGTSGLETRLADIATGNVLKAGGVGVAPAYGKVTSADIDATVAPIASPTFTGTPTLPTGTIGVTQSAGNSTTAIATTAFVTTADNLKANIASPTFTGVPAAPTPVTNVNTTQIPTTAWVNTYFGALAASNVWTQPNDFDLEATFDSGIITLNNNPIQMFGTSNTFFGNLYPTALTSNRNWNLPDVDGTLATTGNITTAIAGLTDNILSKTANYTIVSGDFVAGKKKTLDLYVDATAGNVTITLPTASTVAGYTIYITKTDVSVNTVTINTVLGLNTLITQYQERQYNNDGTSWYNH